MADTDTDQAPKPRKPITEELAKSRGFGVVVGQPFVELLQPEDSVLRSKGRDYRLYRETLRDDQCASSFGDRRLAVTSKEWEVEAASEDALDVAAADFIRAQVGRLEWDRITDGMLYARWYGHAVAECLWAIEGDQVVLSGIKVRKRDRFQYDNEGGIYLLNTKTGAWDLLPDRKFWAVNVGADNDDEPYGLGLAHYCYWPVFFKRNNLKFWLVFTEKFGSPTIVGKMPAGKWDDEELKEQILDALSAFTSESTIVIPDEVTAELMEAARSGQGTYDDLHDRMDRALAKIIVGQTASGGGTPGKLGEEKLQAEVRMDLVKADADLVCSSFNRTVVHWLTEWNFPGAKPPKVWRKVEPEDDLAEAAATDKAIKELGFQPSEEYVKERYGAHWTKAEPPPALVPGALGPGNPGQSPLDRAAEFAEFGALATIRAGKRADQQAIKDAAAFLASRYEENPRVGELLSYAEDSGDYATFGERLAELMEAAPPAPMVERIRRANTFSRLWGMLKGER